MSQTSGRIFSLLHAGFLRTAVASLGLKIGAAGIGFINGVLLARMLGPAEFGVYSIVLLLVNFAATVAVMGLPMLITRETAAKAEHGQWNNLKGLLRAAYGVTFIAALTIVGICVTLLGVGIVEAKVSWSVIIVAISMMVMSAFNQLRASILRGLHWVVLADVPELLLRPIVLLMLLAVTYLSANSAAATQALSMQMFAIFISWAVGIWLLAKNKPMGLKAAIPEMPQRILLLSGLPFLAIAVVGTLDGQISLYMLGYLRGAEEAGLYQAANQFVSLIVLGLIAVNMSLQPKLAAAWARGDKHQMQRQVTEAAYVGTGIALIGVLVILLFAEAIMLLYGSQYIGASNALRLLAIGQMFNAMAGSCGTLLMMTGHQRVVMQGAAVSLLLNLTIAYLAIPEYGVLGCALSVTVSTIFWNIFYVMYAKNKLDVNTTVLNIFRSI